LSFSACSSLREFGLYSKAFFGYQGEVYRDVTERLVFDNLFRISANVHIYRTAAGVLPTNYP